jgi:hypothetical protein
MTKISAKAILKGISNIPDWKTKRRIVVIESDDWGTIRMPSVESFKRLEGLGIDLRFGDMERFNLYDNLATKQDLEFLFEVLSSVKDSRGEHAVFTPISIVANPDFQKIEASGFQEYFYEPFTDTLKRFPGCENAFDLWKEGMEKKLFVPQMHGREHLNVISWMGALQAADKHTISAFKEESWGFKTSFKHIESYQAAFELASPSDLEYHKTVLQDGLQLFEKLFGYKAVYFVSPNVYFSNTLNRTLAENGIKYRSTAKIQREVSDGNKKTRTRLHYHGQKEKHGIRYMIRNCVFEPNRDGDSSVDTCLNQIYSSFKWNKPAIISTHRANFVGALSPENRDKGLRQLTTLLKEIVKNWPDVEFMTSEQVAALMDK